VRLLRRLVAVVALSCSTWASIVDNPVVCPDEISHQGGDRHHGTPPGSHCCLTAPCRTPTVSPSLALAVEPVPAPTAAPASAAAAFSGIDAPAPPTPPPNSFDLA
jgi:hypothetical protein